MWQSTISAIAFGLPRWKGRPLRGVGWRPGQKVQIAMGSAFIRPPYTGSGQEPCQIVRKGRTEHDHLDQRLLGVRPGSRRNDMQAFADWLPSSKAAIRTDRLSSNRTSGCGRAIIVERCKPFVIAMGRMKKTHRADERGPPQSRRINPNFGGCRRICSPAIAAKTAFARTSDRHSPAFFHFPGLAIPSTLDFIAMAT